MDQGEKIMEKYLGVQVPDQLHKADAKYVVGWKDGVYSARMSGVRTKEFDPDTEEIKAFAAITQDEPNKARSLVQRMSGKDRAVLSFYLHELSEIVQDEEYRRTFVPRDVYPDGYDG